MKPFEQSFLVFESHSMKKRLEEIYSAVPSGTCIGSTRCCCESVNCFYSEYLNVVQELRTKGTYDEFAKRAIRYWLCEFSLPMNCPLLQENGLCAVYESRPLPCRVFGHLNREDFESNIEAIREQNLDAADELFELYGIKVPESVTSGQVGYCHNFKSDNVMSSDDRDDMIDILFNLESKFLSEEILDFDEFNFSLTQWFAYELLGRETAMEMRIKIAQEFSQTGKSETLEKWESGV